MKHLRFLILQLGFLMFALLAMASPGNCIKAYAFDKPALGKPMSNADTVLLKLKFRLDLINFQTVESFNGVQFYRDGIIFLSDSKNETKMLPDHLSFGALDTYYTPIAGQDIGKHELFSRKIRFPYPPEATSFTSDYKTIFFTKDSQTGNNKKIPKIYQTHYVTGKDPKKSDWSSDFKVLAFCNDSNSYMHPAVSSNGKIMVFSSNRPSGSGGIDLFMVKRYKSTWANPVNLGPNVNSGDSELYPFLDSHNNLFFSSNRSSGYGGYDIYVSSFNGKGWNKPVNLGETVNSNNDESSFKISRENDSLAFFVSRQESEPGIAQLHKTFVIDNTNYPLFKEPLASTKAIVTPPKPIQVIEEKKPVIIPVITPPPPVKPSKKEKVEVIPAPKKEVVKKPDVIVFRVQIISSTKPKRNFRKVNIDNREYATREYYYKGEYRYTIGEFDSVDLEIISLQRKARKAGFPQAFVAAFKNNVRETDLKIFQH